ncbi:PAS domain S-box protein [Mastigocoleus testarum]|uniref:Histidine kinase n=1 Tax=Mastigocoleus testarum BC008 TaxID=371196 RepID=A0A0V7ZJH2_9CYAN|nr:PAS domain S-box protein [Mastigocoleus testarum]KST64556.1 hypothetical protein BC008_18175 [Mastigocoleus testarum BC008]KST68468.1 hypothetical protein BC008_00940 [Mastigocoleus testarum BC008]
MSQSDSLRVAIDVNPPCISLETTVAEVVLRMNQGSLPRLRKSSILEEKSTQKRYSYALVMGDGELRGILTERDIVRLAVQNLDFEGTPVNRVMSSPVKTLLFHHIDSSLAVINFFRIHRIRHLPILDKQGNLMGTVTPESIRATMQSTDLLRLRTVEESMTGEVVTVSSNATIITAVSLMLKNQVSCVVIIENQGINIYSAGIITERDLKLVREIFTNFLVRKQTDEELRQYQHHLESLVDLRTKLWRRSAACYQHLYENTPVMLHSINIKGELVSVSNMWLHNLGYEHHEVIGRKYLEFLTQKSQQYAQQKFPEYLQNGICIDIPYQMVCKNGKVIDILLSAIAQKDETGQIVRSLAVMTDVTERNIAEKALQESEQRFRRMADAAPVLIWSSRADKFCDYLSKGWLDFTGRTLEQEMGDGWTEGVHPDDLKRCLDTYLLIS